MKDSKCVSCIRNNKKWLVFKATVLICKAILGRGQPGLMRWIYYESCPWCRIDRSTCWPAVQCATTVLWTWCFRPRFCSLCKAILGRGQPVLMRWICYESRPWCMINRSTFGPAIQVCYYCVMEVPTSETNKQANKQTNKISSLFHRDTVLIEQSSLRPIPLWEFH